MSQSVKFLTPLALFLALVVLLFYGLGTDPRKVPSPLIGKPAPEFVLPVLGEPQRTVSNQALLGQVSLVNVWASWCVSCRAEHAELMRLAREEKDIQIFGLNWKDEAPDALRMLRQTGNPYVVSAYDPDNQVGIHFGVYGAPETFVVDQQGIIRHKHIGPIDRRAWEETLRPLVQQIKAES
ncbi:MAG: DsbE family thiol:disulfide interchange protein [Chromatiaceae bacterium]|jgi:cytochrome c biogenesis protein CcmG/thiol:disulfide interchange protein DsbE|nr:DsbE family thiol:disulfide interchange protein [Chromatiaceae bacterium]